MSERRPGVLLRAACRPEIGTGHLRRCLTLARTLARRGEHVEVVADDHPIAHRLLADVDDVPTGTAPAGMVPPVDRARIATLVLDVPAEDRPAGDVRALGRQIADLDRSGVAVVALGHATTDSSHLRAVIDLYPSTQVTALNYIEGPQYLILRPQFGAAPPAARSGDGPILVAMGGSDPFDLAGTTLRALAAVGIRRPVHLVLGLGSSLDAGDAADLADDLGLELRVDVELGPDELVEAMRGAAVAIGAFGTMAFELMALGVPVIGMSHYRWQDESARWFAELGALAHVGCAETGLGVDELSTRLAPVITDGDALDRLGRRGREVVDGRGAERVADLLVDFARESEDRGLDELYVLAHPGDEVFGCGATIAAQVKAGARVGLVILGEGGDARRDETHEPGEVVDSRAELALALQRSAERLGVASLYYYRFADNRFDHHDLLDLVRPVEVLLERHRPSRVWTHHPDDLNVDHRRTFEAVATAARPRLGGSVTSLLSVEVPSSSDWGVVLGGGFRPNWFEDVEDLLELKLELAAGYPTELRDAPHPRSIEGLRTRAASWGGQCGLTAAEAFVLHRRIGRSS